MTSKEALNHIVNCEYNEATFYPIIFSYDGMTKKDMIKLIEKDLEVLELLKSLIKNGEIKVSEDTLTDYPEIKEWLNE